MVTPPDSDLRAKTDRLLGVLGQMPGAAVALSGGVDSSVVAKAAVLALGDRAVAVTADSPSVPRAELEQAKTLAAAVGIRHVVVGTNEFDDPNYLRNGGDRGSQDEAVEEVGIVHGQAPRGNPVWGRSHTRVVPRGW